VIALMICFAVEAAVFDKDFTGMKTA